MLLKLPYLLFIDKNKYKKDINMIRTTLMLDAINETVIRPMAITIINDIKNILYINNDVRSKLENQISDFITNDQNDLLNSESTRIKSEDIKFSVTEEFNKDSLLSIVTDAEYYKPIVNDPTIGLKISPVYYDTTLNLNIKYRSKSKIKLNNIIDMLKMRMVNNNNYLVHNLKYSFNFSMALMELLLDIHLLKEYDKPVSFEDYLVNITDGRLKVIGGLDGNTDTISFKIEETQLENVGFFDYDIVDVKAEYGNETSIWEANINYKVDIIKPVSLNIVYPMLVDNKMLDDKYLVIKKVNDNKLNNYDMARSPLNRNPLNRTIEDSEVDTLRIPNFDAVPLLPKQPYYRRVFTVLCTIASDDKRSLFNLNELPGYKVKQDILDFIKNGEYNYMTQPFDSMLNITLIINNDDEEFNILEIDEDLNIYSKIDLDITKTYRVSFNVVEEALVLKGKAVDRTANNVLMTNAIFDFYGVRTNDRPKGLSMINNPDAYKSARNGFIRIFVESLYDEDE